MWETKEGDIKISLCYEISAIKRCRKQCSSRHYSFQILFIATLFIESTGTIHFHTIHFCIFFITLQTP